MKKMNMENIVKVSGGSDKEEYLPLTITRNKCGQITIMGGSEYIYIKNGREQYDKYHQAINDYIAAQGW